MLMDQAMNIMEKIVKELKESEPEKRNHFIETAVMLLEISTEVMKESPEFRKAFAAVHSEFLKYPESKETIHQSFDAYQKYIQ